MPGGPSAVTEGYRRSPPQPPTLGPKTGGPPRHFRFTDAPVIYSVSCVWGIKNTVFYRVSGPSAAENFILAMSKKPMFFHGFCFAGRKKS